MVTFLVLNIIMTIVTAAASIVVTVAMAFWNGISYSTTDCTTVGDKCVCSNGYSYETFDGRPNFIVSDTYVICQYNVLQCQFFNKSFLATFFCNIYHLMKQQLLSLNTGISSTVKLRLTSTKPWNYISVNNIC